MGGHKSEYPCFVSLFLYDVYNNFIGAIIYILILANLRTAVFFKKETVLMLDWKNICSVT